MKQINLPFGENCEFTCTVVDGDISAQGFDVSCNDALVSIKLDSGSYLTPKMLRQLANQIEGTSGGLKRATSGEASELISEAKNWLKDNSAFSGLNARNAFIIAEYEANKEGKTLYECNEKNEEYDDDVRF